MRVVAIIQARMGSKRLPGKVLLDIGGATMLAHVVRRVQRAAQVQATVVATTTVQADGAIVAECERLGVPVFRGNEQDVLDRYYQTARSFGAEAVVRITSDCPLIDPEVIDHVVAAYLERRPDYASNVLDRTYPRGLDTEVIALSALESAWREAAEAYQRVHVTPYIYQHPERFRLLSLTNEVDYSGHRWTVDTVEDLTFIREVYGRLGNDEGVTWRDLVALLDRDPALLELNRLVQQKALQDG